jgi:methyl-accepting chemotaxis protein
MERKFDPGRADHPSMQRIRNLPLAVRLAGAFGALTAALVLVGFTGVHSMNSLSSKADDLAKRDLKAAELLGDVRERAKNDVNLGQQHLYLHDGELAVEDRLARQIRTNDAAIARDAAELRRTLAGTGAIDEYDRFAQLRAQLVQAMDVAIQRSRAETVRKAENRDGSRNYFTSTILPLDGQIDAAGAALTAVTNRVADKAATSANSTASSGSHLILIIAIAAVLLAIAVAVAVTRSVVRPVKGLAGKMESLEQNGLTDLAQVLGAVAEGDLTREIETRTTPIEVKSTDELGRRSATFNGMLAKAQESVEAYNAMRAGLSEAIAEVATGAGTVASASQQMASTSEEAGRAVGEIASAVTDVAHGAERQVRMVESTREAVQEASRAAGASAETATATAEAAEQTRTVAMDGVRAAEQATSAIQQVAESSAQVGAAIQDLSAKSEQIGGIVDTITGIAEQTNLLALNAAIEAARAGEQGRGFAVVAEEVRKLAEESQRATGQIAELVRDIQAETENAVRIVAEGGKRTADGVATVEQTREAFEAIGVAVDDMNARVGQIAAAVQQISAEAARAENDINEVAAVAEQSSASAEQVSASTQQTSASTQEIASSATELARTAEQLDSIVSRFRLTV